MDLGRREQKDGLGYERRKRTREWPGEAEDKEAAERDAQGRQHPVPEQGRPEQLPRQRQKVQMQGRLMDGEIDERTKAASDEPRAEDEGSLVVFEGEDIQVGPRDDNEDAAENSRDGEGR